MSILITGGTGFIGAELARQLLARSETEIHITHRSGNLQRLAGIADELHFHQLDMADSAAVARTVAEARPRVIFHLAAMLTGPSEANPQAAVETNAIGTYTLLEAAREHGVEQFLFSSSIGSYGSEVQTPEISDLTIQRPYTVYGVTKVFGEQLGRYYKRRFGLDFRGIRYPSVIGPGVKTPSVVQYTSWMIEEPAKGNAFTIQLRPETTVPVIYYKEAAEAMMQLADAPLEHIQMVNYLVDGRHPTPTAGELADVVRARVPGAAIDFAPDENLQGLIDSVIKPIDDRFARDEWGWEPSWSPAEMVDDFLAELAAHPERYG